MPFYQTSVTRFVVDEFVVAGGYFYSPSALPSDPTLTLLTGPPAAPPSASAPDEVTLLNTVTAYGTADLLVMWSATEGALVGIPPIDVGGADTLSGGVLIDQVGTNAGTAAAGDKFLVSQDGTNLVVQTFSALNTFVQAQLPSYLATYQAGLRAPVVEVTASGTIDSSWNGSLRVLSQLVTLTAIPSAMGSGFGCEIVNMASGACSLGGVTSTTESGVLATGQSARLRAFTYSGGTVAFATMSGSSTITTPGQVTGLAVGTLTSSTAALSWNALSGASSYVVLYRVTGQSSWNSQAAGGTSQTITGLTPSTEYDFEVYAVNAAGTGTPSTLVNGSTPAAPTAPPSSAPTVTVGTITGTSVTLSWTTPATATGFTVNFRTTGSSSWNTFATNISGTGTTVTGLTAATAYDFEVAGVNSAGTGPYSSVVNATTTANAPGAITGVTLGTPTATTLPISWTLPTSGGAIANITVQYRTPSGSGSYTTFSSTVSPTATGTTITGLTAATAYDVQVFATNSGGSGTAGTLTNVSTASGLPGAVTSLTNGTVTSSTVPLSWVDPTSGAAATAITVQYRLHGGSSWTTAISTLGPTQTSYTVGGLTASTAYDFQVFATNGSGSGTAAVLSNVSTGSATATWTITTLGTYTMPETLTYSLSDTAPNDANAQCAVTVSPNTASEVWFFFSSSSSAAPAIGSTLNTSGGTEGSTANGIWYGGPPYPRSVGTYYVYAVAVNASNVVGGTLTGPAVTVTT